MRWVAAAGCSHPALRRLGKEVRCRRIVGDDDPYGGQESAACVERRHTWVPPYKG